MPFTSDDGTGRQARFERDGSITSWGGGEKTCNWKPEPRSPRERRERTECGDFEHREAKRREVECKEAERREVERKEVERKEQERKEQKLIQKMNEEITDSHENTNVIESRVASSEPTNTKAQEKKSSDSALKNNTEVSNSSSQVANVLNKAANNVTDFVLGKTYGSCLGKQEAFDDGVDLVRATTVGACMAAAGEGGANIPINLLCGAGLVVTPITRHASNSWREHCSTLPTSSTQPPN